MCISPVLLHPSPSPFMGQNGWNCISLPANRLDAFKTQWVRLWWEFLLREGLVKNLGLWQISNRNPPHDGNIRGFLSNIHCKDMVQLLENKTQKVWGRSIIFCNSWICPCWASRNSSVTVQLCLTWASKEVLVQGILLLAVCILLSFFSVFGIALCLMTSLLWWI